MNWHSGELNIFIDKVYIVGVQTKSTKLNAKHCRSVAYLSDLSIVEYLCGYPSGCQVMFWL